MAFRIQGRSVLGGYFAREGVEAGEQLGVSLVGGGGIEGFHVKGAVGIKLALAHLVEFLKALTVDDGEQLFARDGKEDRTAVGCQVSGVRGLGTGNRDWGSALEIRD